MPATTSPHGQDKPGTVPPGHVETVQVKCDGDAFTLERRPYSTEELLQAFSVAAGYLLNLKRTNGLDTLNPQQRVPLKEGMEFFTQAPGGASS
jgi:hypothetical protein